ncbi:MAG: alpha/beta fold hydrolase [Candidatus Limnocylindrales bacterium]
MNDDPITLRDVWTRLDGLSLLYRTNALPLPAGARTIVHVHGFAISGRYLLPTAWRLAPHYWTFVPDLPGFGRSQHPHHPLGIPELADALARFMDQVGIERAVLLGNSLGCPISAEFLDRYPDRIEAAILCSPAGGQHNRPIYRGLTQLVLAGLREPLGMAPIAVTDYARYGIIPSLDLFWSMIHYPVVERIRELRIPTLVVIGSRDPLVSEKRVRYYAPQLPHVTAVAIDGAAHAINYSHPEQLANVVRAFLEGRPIEDDPAAKGRVRLISAPRES